MVLADVGDSFQRALDEFFTWLPSLLGALAILIIGYIVAKVVAGLVRRGVAAAGADRALESGRAREYHGRLPDRSEEAAGASARRAAGHGAGGRGCGGNQREGGAVGRRVGPARGAGGRIRRRRLTFDESREVRERCNSR